MEMGWEQLLPILLNQLMGTRTTTHDDEKIRRMMRDILVEHSSSKDDKNYEVTQKILELLEKSMEAKKSEDKVEELTQKVNELMKEKEEKASTSPAPQQEETNTNPPNDGDEVKKIYQMLEEIKTDMKRGKQRQNRGGGAFAKFNKQNRGGEWRNHERSGNAETPRHDYYGEQRRFPQQSEASGGFSQLVGNPPFENPGFQNQFDQPEFKPKFQNNDQREHRPVFHNRGRGSMPPHFRRPPHNMTSTNDDQNKNSNQESHFAGEYERPYTYNSERGRSNFQHRGQFRGRGHGFDRGGHSQGRGQFHNKKDSSQESQGHVKKEFKKSDHKQAPKNVQSTAEVDLCQLFMKLQQQMEEQKKGQNSQQTCTKTAFKLKSQQVKHTTETNMKPKNKDTNQAGASHSKEGNKTKKGSATGNSSNSDKGAKKKQNTKTTPNQNSSSSNLSFNIQLQLGNN